MRETVLFACVLGCAAMPFVFAVAMGLSASFVAAALSAALVATLIAAWQSNRPAIRLDWSASSRPFVAICVAAAVLAILLVSRLTVFMVDPGRTSWSHVPSSDWELRHSCLSAYYVAAEVVRQHPNVYDESLYSVPGTDPKLPRRGQMIGIFKVDQYEYPPPFLLTPRALSLIAPDFVRFRALWFGLNGLVAIVALIVAARTLDAPGATRALLLAPFVLAAPAALTTLQKGNAQLLVIAVSVLAMTLIAKRHRAAGGALLALVTVGKLYPALLVAYLVARRDWRAVTWTAVFSGLFVVLTLADVGWAPFAAFREHLPGLMGGEAFPAFRNPPAVGLNLSIPGLVLKTKLLGLPSGGFAAMHLVGTAYMLVALATTVVLALRTGDATDGPIVWLTVLVLATLRSPFLPWGYGSLPALWLVTLLAAAAVPKRWTIPQWLAAVVVLGVVVPPDVGLDARALALITTFVQVAMIALAILVIRHRTSTPVAVQHAEPLPTLS